MCSQCLMDSFQAHKHDAPDIVGYKVFLDSADSCLKDYHNQIHSTRSKSLDILQQLLDENKSRLSVTRTKVFEILNKCFTSLAEEICSIESTVKAKAESDAGLMNRLERITMQLATKQTASHHLENDVMFLASFLVRDSRQNTFRLNTEKFKKTVGARNNDKELRGLRDKCDDFRKTLSIVAKWAQKLKKNFEGNQMTELAPELRTVFSPAKQKVVSATKGPSSPHRRRTKRTSDFRISDKENGDVIRKRLHMTSEQPECGILNKTALQIDTVGVNYRKISHCLDKPLNALRGNLRLSPTRRHSPKKSDCGLLADCLGPFSFLDSLQVQPVKKPSMLHQLKTDDADRRPATSYLMQTPMNHRLSNPNRAQVVDNDSFASNGAGYMLARRFESDRSTQTIHYLESHAITFTCRRDLDILGFTHFQVAESQPNFVAYMEYALIDGDGIDDDDERDLRVAAMRTGDFQIKRDPEHRLRRVFFEKTTKLLRGKQYTIRVTSKSKAKFSCWEGKEGRDASGPFIFKKTRDPQFYRLVTSVVTGQIPELLYTM